MRTRSSQPFIPRLPAIPEQPAPPRPPPAPWQAGDRVMVVAPDGYVRTGAVVARQSSGGKPPVLWVRLSSGRALPLDCPGLTVLRRL